jgi:hypothetical protein
LRQLLPIRQHPQLRVPWWQGRGPRRLVFGQVYSKDSPQGSEQTHLLWQALLLVESREQDW